MATLLQSENKVSAQHLLGISGCFSWPGTRSASPSWTVQASTLPSLFPREGKQRPARASQHAEAWGCLREPTGSGEQRLGQLVSQEPQYLCSSHCLSSAAHTFTCHNPWCQQIYRPPPAFCPSEGRVPAGASATHTSTQPCRSPHGLRFCSQGQRLVLHRVLFGLLFPEVSRFAPE